MKSPTREEIDNSPIEINGQKAIRVAYAMEDVYATAESSVKTQKNLALTVGLDAKDIDEYEKIQTHQKSILQRQLRDSKDKIIKALNKANDSIEKIAGVKPNLTNTKDANLLVASVFNQYGKDLKVIRQLTRTKPLYDAILEATQKGIDDSIMVNYTVSELKDDKTGEILRERQTREVPFKSYMEMKVRTEVNTEIGDNLTQSAGALGIVFYVCDYYGDCAKDHIDYQGKYYFDENWTGFGYDEDTSTRIQNAIDSQNMLSIQYIRGDPVALTTRPNCRHTLSPVTLTEVIGTSPIDMTKKLGKNYNGRQSDDKTEATQQARSNERVIRKYKDRVVQGRIQYKKTKNPDIKRQLGKDYSKWQEWRDKQTQLVKDNPHLKRDERREDKRILVQDLGAGYHLGLKTDFKNTVVNKN